jgi:hypothetical protein
MNQKGSTTLIAIVMLVVVLVAAGAYYLVTQKNNSNYSQNNINTLSSAKPSSSASTSTSNQTTNWKTYINTTFLYSIKYPSEYQTAKSTADDTQACVFDNKGICVIAIAALKNDNNYTNDQLINNQVGSSIRRYKQTSNSIEWVYFDTVHPPTSRNYLTIHNGNWYEVSASIDRPADIDFLNKILPTFKFLEQNRQISPSPLPQVSFTSISIWEINATTTVELLITGPTGKQTGYLPANDKYVTDLPNSRYYTGGGISNPSGVKPPLLDVRNFHISDPQTGLTNSKLLGNKPESII